MSAQGFPASTYISPYQLGQTVVGTYVKKGPLPLPQTGTSNLFTVTGGAVLVSLLIGVVMTAVQNQACNLSLGLAPTVGAANTAGIGGPTSIQALALGSHIAPPFAVGVPGATLVAPAVPASTVNALNGYHGTVAVTISAGTITAVTVNGVVVGSTAGTYFVPAHGTISITYSVAPTWTWASSTALDVLHGGGGEFITREFVAPAGTITWTTSASNTGTVTWYLAYIQLDSQPGLTPGSAGVAVVSLWRRGRSRCLVV